MPASSCAANSVTDLSGVASGFRQGSANAAYQYDANGSVTNDPNKGLALRYNVLNKVDLQTASPSGTGPSGTVTYDYDANGTVLRRTIAGTSATGQPLNKTLTYVDGFIYDSSVNSVTSVPTPEGRALLLPATPAKMVYEYHLRDQLGNLRVAFRADRQPEQLHLAMEDPTSNEEGPYPKFQNVTASRSAAGTSYHGPTVASGSYSAAVTWSQPGPLTRMPVAQGDQLKVSLWYLTPSGTQYDLVAQSAPIVSVPALAWSVAPALLAAPPAGREVGPATPRPALGLQLSVTGLLSRMLAGKKAGPPVPVAAGTTGPAPSPLPNPQRPVYAYVAMRLYDQQNQLVQQWQQTALVVNTTAWNQLRFLVTPDLSSLPSRTGYLEVQLLNDGSQPVFFDSLTVRHPKDVVLVSQENHYYPLGLALTGVAVNTQAQPQASKALFNGGSNLEDDVLGDAGIYSTFYRTYDPALGRFQGVDPLADHYADWTPYQFATGNPLLYNDPTGAYRSLEDLTGPSYTQSSGFGGGGGGGGGYGGGGGFGDRGYGGSPVNDWGSGYWGGGPGGVLFAAGGSGIAGSWNQGNSNYNQTIVAITHEALYATGLNGKDEDHSPITTHTGQYWTSYQITTTGQPQEPIDNFFSSDAWNRCDAVVGLFGAVAEITIGVAIEGFTGGISTFLVVDGFYRATANVSRLVAYSTGNKEIGNNIPTSGGAILGKLIDGANGTNWNQTGTAQASLGMANDLTTLILSGGSGSAVEAALSNEHIMLSNAFL